MDEVASSEQVSIWHAESRFLLLGQWSSTPNVTSLAAIQAMDVDEMAGGTGVLLLPVGPDQVERLAELADYGRLKRAVGTLQLV